MAPINIINFDGEANVPQDVRRRRKQVMQTMRRMGTPVIIKHMWTAEDFENGIVERSPYMDDIYNQTRHDDPLSHGQGWVSIEKSPDEWYDSEGNIVVSVDSPGSGFLPAPKYRGFGPGYLTYIILPDVAEDMFKLDPSGALIRIQTANAQMAWYPEVNDTDLITLVEIDRQQQVRITHERYQAKMTSPVSLRGYDRRGQRREDVDFGNQYAVNQTFQLDLIPPNDVLYNVEVDR